MTAPGHCTICHGKHLAEDHDAAFERKLSREVHLVYLFAGIAIFLLCVARPALVLAEMIMK